VFSCLHCRSLQLHFHFTISLLGFYFCFKIVIRMPSSCKGIVEMIIDDDDDDDDDDDGCIEILHRPHRRKIWHALTLTLTLNLTLTIFCAGVAGVVFLYTG